MCSAPHKQLWKGQQLYSTGSVNESTLCNHLWSGLPGVLSEKPAERCFSCHLVNTDLAVRNSSLLVSIVGCEGAGWSSATDIHRVPPSQLCVAARVAIELGPDSSITSNGSAQSILLHAVLLPILKRLRSPHPSTASTPRSHCKVHSCPEQDT